jgi:hypothetical protein
MPSNIGIGVGAGLDSNSAARNAVQQALNQIGSARPTFVITIISQEYDVNESLKIVTSYFASAPIWGFSASGTFTSFDINARCIFVIVFTDRAIIPQSYWWPQYSSDPKQVELELDRLLEPTTNLPSGILLAADGVNGNINLIRRALTESPIQISGVLAGGDFRIGKTYQISDTNCGTGSLSMALLSGEIRLGIGVARGWQSSGLSFQINQSDGLSIHLLDHNRPTEAYSAVFGRPVESWNQPPLSELVRLYPLGIEKNWGNNEIMIHAPLFVETDGSFRLNIPLEGEPKGHLMVGDHDHCIQAAQFAAEQALNQLGHADPVLGLVWVDISWQLLFKNNITPILQALHFVLGEDLPLIGAFTLGHIARPSTSLPCSVSNQDLALTLIGTYT